MALGDLVVVWRLYVVWGRNLWIAILPISMVVGEFGELRVRFVWSLCYRKADSVPSLVAGYGSISQWLLPNPVPETMVRWGTAMFAISLTTNVLVTAIIASRIW